MVKEPGTAGACGRRPPGAGGRRRRRGAALLGHGEEVAGFAVEGDGAGAVHGLQVLLHLETWSGCFSLTMVMVPLPVGAEGFHGGGVEDRAVGTAGQRQAGEDLAVVGAEDHHHGLRGLRGRVAGAAAGGEENLVLRVDREAVAAAFIDERVMGDGLHGLHVDGGDAADGVLHDDVEHALAIGHALLRHAAEVDGAEHGAVLRIDDRRVFGGMAEDVDALVEGVEVDAVGAGRRRRRCVLIRAMVLVSNMETLGWSLVKPWPDLGSTAAPLPPTPGDLAGGFEGVEIEDGEARGDGRRLRAWCRSRRLRGSRRGECRGGGRRRRRRCNPSRLLRRPCGLEDFVGTVGLRVRRRKKRRGRGCEDEKVVAHGWDLRGQYSTTELEGIVQGRYDVRRARGKTMKSLVLLVAMAAAVQASAQGYQVTQTYELGGAGSWDYVVTDPPGHRVYVARQTRVMVIDADSGKLIGEVADVHGAHGTAIAAKSGHGFATSSEDKSVVMFDLKTLKVLSRIPAAEDADAVIYDAPSNRVFTMNGDAHSSTVIDPVAGTQIKNLELGGKPEYARFSRRRQGVCESYGQERDRRDRYEDSDGEPEMGDRAVQTAGVDGDRYGASPAVQRLPQRRDGGDGLSGWKSRDDAADRHGSGWGGIRSGHGRCLRFECGWDADGDSRGRPRQLQGGADGDDAGGIAQYGSRSGKP